MGIIDKGYKTSDFCDDFKAQGGVKRIYIANKSDITSFTKDPGVHAYSSITFAGTTKFFEYEPYRNTTVLTDEGSTEQGVFAAEVTIESFFRRMEKTKATRMQSLIDACGLIIALELNNGEVVIYGYDEKLKTDSFFDATPSAMVEAEAQSKNGYTLVLHGQMYETARLYTGTVASLTV